jgi:hypothetical protein
MVFNFFFHKFNDFFAFRSIDLLMEPGFKFESFEVWGLSIVGTNKHQHHWKGHYSQGVEDATLCMHDIIFVTLWKQFVPKGHSLLFTFILNFITSNPYLSPTLLRSKEEKKKTNQAWTIWDGVLVLQNLINLFLSCMHFQMCFWIFIRLFMHETCCPQILEKQQIGTTHH